MNAKIEYKPPFVAFLDILGYSDLVKEIAPSITYLIIMN
jgi:hypothetical protein